MSVCFFVPADQVGNANVDEGDGDPLCEESKVETAEHTLQQFWAKVLDDIKGVTSEDFKTQPLPLTRIKKIMKLDEEVKMISAEAPVLFAKAAEIFIHELTLRAWSHTEDNKRRTLQRNDIAMAISKSDQFDFLIDIVPRQEVKVSKPRYENSWTGKSTETQAAQPQQTTMQSVPQQQIVLQPSCTQVIQTAGASTSSSSVQQQQPVTLVQQVVQGGDVQNIPSQIQLTAAQLNMIRLQVQNNPSQPIIIQAQPQQSPQIIQVTSQGQHQPQQQVYLAQVSASQDDS